MKILKYLFLISLIAMIASCAKDEEISMGSYKIEMKVTSISPSAVMIEAVNVPSNIELYHITLYKDGVADDGAYSDYQHNDDRSHGRHGFSDINHCVIKNLEPDTKYAYTINIGVNSGSVNHGGEGYNYGNIVLSDSSYTFTTNAPSTEETDNPLYATMATEAILPNIAILHVRLNDNLRFDSSLRVYLCKDESGTDIIDRYTRYIDVADDERSCLLNFKDLEPGTKYYVFVVGDFEYSKQVNGYIFEQSFEHVPLLLEPNSFTTTVEDLPDNILDATMTTDFLLHTNAVLRIKLNDNLKFEDCKNACISIDENGSSIIDAYYTVMAGDYSSCELHFKDIDPGTKYYVFVCGDYRYSRLIDGHTYVVTIENAFLKLKPTSFTTLSVEEIALAHMSTLSVTENSARLRIDFNKYLDFYEYYPYGLDLSIGTKADGSDAHVIHNINSDKRTEYGDGYIEFTVDNLQPSTKYYIFWKNQEIYLSFSHYDDYFSIDFNIEDNSFTTLK